MIPISEAATSQPKSSSGFLHLLSYTLGAGTIITLYIIAPAMSAWSTLLPAHWEQLLATLGSVGLAELGIFVILRKTTAHKPAQSSRLDYLRTLYRYRTPGMPVGIAYGLK